MDSYQDLDMSDDDKDTKDMLNEKQAKIREIQEGQKRRIGEAKSNVTIDISPTEIDVDLKELENRVRAIKMDGIKWLGSQVIDVAFGIQKIRILCQIIDVKVASPDIIVDEIEKDPDVQSAQIFAFQMA
jgi:elongation factor 1-beta